MKIGKVYEYKEMGFYYICLAEHEGQYLMLDLEDKSAEWSNEDNWTEAEDQSHDVQLINYSGEQIEQASMMRAYGASGLTVFDMEPEGKAAQEVISLVDELLALSKE